MLTTLRIRHALSFVFLAAMLATSQPVRAQSDHHTVGDNIDWASGGIRLEYDNDLLVSSDDKFTSGMSVQWHSKVATSWDQIGAPAWMKIGRLLPGMRSADLYRRLGAAVGQNMQTPNDLDARELIEDDVPYAGSLGFELNWVAFDDDVFRGYALIAGVVGPLSGAEATQKAIHKIIGGDKPRGWRHQIPNEPAINFNGMFKKKVLRFEGKRHLSADVSLDLDFGIGTALTFGEVGAEIRAGWNVPFGFTFVPDPIGRTIAYDATVPHKQDGHTSIYLSLVHRQTYMQHFVFLDGSLWRDSHSVDYDRLQHQTIVGFHVTRRRWGVHVSFWDSSANVRTPLAGSGNDFGTVAFEWRF